jgi:hypothetical protein
MSCLKNRSCLKRSWRKLLFEDLLEFRLETVMRASDADVIEVPT